MINMIVLPVSLLILATRSLAIDVLFNSFHSDDLIISGDARVDSSVIKLSSNTNQYSLGRAFYPYPVSYKRNVTVSTSFVFSILPERTTNPGFGFAFIYSNSTAPVDARQAPLLFIKFDIGLNPEFGNTIHNHIGINYNSPVSFVTHVAGYYNSSTGAFVPVELRSGKNVQAWIEFDGKNLRINVTIAPVGVPKPSKPLISTSDPSRADFGSEAMFMGFSTSKTTWNEGQTILAWSLSDEGFAREINTSNLPVLRTDRSSGLSSLSTNIKATIIAASILVPAVLISAICWFWIKKRKDNRYEDDTIQEWELEYWPHRFSFQELNEATKGFSKSMLLGSGGFGKVYRGTLPTNVEIAVKCVNQDSRQGLREFMAEISSIGRLQHKNLIHMRGWCKKGQELMLVYDFMLNGSLSSWIFGKSENHLDWKMRRRVLMDVAEALSYLHHGWHQLVLHRDIKSSNILLDSNMRARVGDFGLAKLNKHGQAANTTRVVGTIGYMAPELVRLGPSAASDVYGFGVVILEVVCGRRPMEGEKTLIEWVQELHEQGRLCDSVDRRIVADEYEVSDIEMVLNLGLACCDVDPQLRPTMKEVTEILIKTDTLPSSEYLIDEVESRFTSSSNADGSVITKASFISDPSPRT
ncbi:L-type lectin-domain containing receptor kinase S.1 [Ricinus communis]|uniref:non-specific serine/threonine protein kinase n=1 Tax=Ricinus communis TaxID=3988 RepID=B9SPL3_RICCO|nr:L-type lectin-domain containing receptor kinase S.1 [Ricinus communis]EEF34489.1 carbohydrate binding protein, putative [Ricinus communis]|eukprot:XP_002527932.3 L-type lectin-domain containing receptor kinase S.1 [Ricinus communis]